MKTRMFLFELRFLVPPALESSVTWLVNSEAIRLLVCGQLITHYFSLKSDSTLQTQTNVCEKTPR